MKLKILYLYSLNYYIRTSERKRATFNFQFGFQLFIKFLIRLWSLISNTYIYKHTENVQNLV